MEFGKTVEKGGVYCCLYHKKNKIKIKCGSTFPRCDFAGLICLGNWHLLKEVHEKTRAEFDEQRNRQKQRANSRQGRDKEFFRKLDEPKFNKWDFEKW